MVAKDKRNKRKAKRHAFDRYFTPSHAMTALFDGVPEIGGRSVVDPCAGGTDTAMIRALSERFEAVVTNDIDPSLGCKYNFDASRQQFWDMLGDCEPHVRWAVFNPPFSRWGQIAGFAVKAGYSVACLLRIAALEVVPSRSWLQSNPPNRLHILPRIKFRTGTATDNCCYVWAIWSPVAPSGVSYTPLSGRQKSFFFGETLAA